MLHYKPIAKCGTTYTNPFGVITTPIDYRGLYPNNICEHRINVSDATHIVVEVLRFVSTHRSDWFAIYNGSTTDAFVLANFTDTDSQFQSYQTTNNVLIQYRSDRPNNEDGYKIVYHANYHGK